MRVTETDSVIHQPPRRIDVKMNSLTLFVFAAILTVTFAVGQYYMPRAYYTIDAEGHQSPPVPLRRLARSLRPYPYKSSASANANANANAWGGDANAEANANANANAFAPGSHGRGFIPPKPVGTGSYSVPLGSGQISRRFGAVQGQSVSVGASAGLGPSGVGYYDQYSSVH